ncbi:cyclic lactone autoinducer peptide [Paenibacillus elgii]
MKLRIAYFANILLVFFATMAVSTNSLMWHRPETPEELLKK